MSKSKTLQFLDHLNKEYAKLHKSYEELFWISYMGDHSVDKKKDKSLAKLDAFRANPKFVAQIQKLKRKSNAKEKERLKLWLKFFNSYQTPKAALPLKKKIDMLESKVLKLRASRKEGYINPHTNKFVPASAIKMSMLIATNDDEKIRKACFEAREKLAVQFVDEYIELVSLRNQFARKLGYKDFYDYKVQQQDGMTKEDLFGIFEDIYEKTKYAKADIRNLEKKTPGILKPWNFGYLMAGDFTKEEDQYYQFEDSLIRWGRSFSALGFDFRGAQLKLDLLDRKGKYNNGFCHWPDLVQFVNGKRKPGSSNFTCNVVLGQVGSGIQGFDTLFHEGGHAAHMLNIEQEDVCVCSEYAPMAASWAETQSMFMDTMFSSIEWRTRYALNKKGKSYPFDLFRRKVEKLNLLRPLGLNSIIFVCNFEREIYEAEKLNSEKVRIIARNNFRKYFERSEDSLSALNVPHIYSWESSASYHGYGLAEIALEQWREYFYQKYGYIVDNPDVGREMKKVWAFGSAKSFSELVALATGKKLSSGPILKDLTASVATILKRARQRLERMKTVRPHDKPVELNAVIRMVSGKKIITDNRKSFEDMAKKYRKWLKIQ